MRRVAGAGVTRVQAVVVAVAGLVVAFVAAGCTESDRSYAVVKVVALGEDFTGVGQLLVRAESGSERRSDHLFPREPTRPFTISARAPVDFSLSFERAVVGMLTVGVQPLDAMSRSMGYGETTAVIDPGHVVRVLVQVERGRVPPAMNGPDGGASPDLGTACQPSDPASCGPGKTCYVGCFGVQPAALCGSAGTASPGEVCMTTADCVAGSQCLPLGCARICMRSCREDADCPDGRCARPIPCGNTTTGFRVCTIGCDPRGDGTGGCAAGLHCQFFNETTVTCDCRPAGATGEPGAPCDEFGDCRPGLACARVAGVATCRPICKLGGGDCAAGQACAATGHLVWGACVAAP